MNEHFDTIIIGSGFGGSVMACRLAESGQKVLVVEQGRRFSDTQFAKTSWNLRKYLWMPRLGCFGILNLRLFKHVFVLHGVGVGGGSLGYATVLMEPQNTFYSSGNWSRLKNWEETLRPFFAKAKIMLGVTRFPFVTAADAVLEQVAGSLSSKEKVHPSEVGICFATPSSTPIPSDPYFNGEGPKRTACTLCGSCLTGCRVGAKNTLVKNYLYFAEKHGSRVLERHKATAIVPIENGYRVDLLPTSFLPFRKKSITATRVVVAAGVLGTVELLLRCRDKLGCLPRLSSRLGSEIRTNGEALLAATAASSNKTDYSRGVAITSKLQINQTTKIEPVRYGKGSNAMRFLAIPYATESKLKSLFKTFSSVFRNLFVTRWSERTTILLAMQTIESTLKLKLRRVGFIDSLQTDLSGNGAPPSARISDVVETALAFAKLINGKLYLSFSDVLFGIPTTAHILGGCPMGSSQEVAVVDENLEVFGYKGLFVVDGSVLSANLGANPSLTIAAFAEYAANRLINSQKCETKGL